MSDKKSFLDEAGINTRLSNIGNDPTAYHGFVNPPVVHA
jgi:cystathionine beta-lyase